MVFEAERNEQTMPEERYTPGIQDMDYDEDVFPESSSSSEFSFVFLTP